MSTSQKTKYKKDNCIQTWTHTQRNTHINKYRFIYLFICIYIFFMYIQIGIGRQIHTNIHAHSNTLKYIEVNTHKGKCTKGHIQRKEDKHIITPKKGFYKYT